MAQLVERLVRNEEASGSNPLISTKNDLNRTTGSDRSFFCVTLIVRAAELSAVRASVVRNERSISSVRLTATRSSRATRGYTFISTKNALKRTISF